MIKNIINAKKTTFYAINIIETKRNCKIKKDVCGDDNMPIFVNLHQKVDSETFILWLILSFVVYVIFSITNIFLYTNLFKVKFTNKQKILVILINSSLRFIEMVIFSLPIYRLINIFTNILLFKFILKQPIEKCILNEAISLITFISFEVIFSKLFCILFTDIDTYANGIYNLRYKLCLLFSISIGRVIVCYVIKKKNITINISDTMSKKNRIRIIFVSLIGCIIIIMNTIEMTLYISKFPYSLFLLDIVSLILYFYISMKDIFWITTLENQDVKINNLESYNKTLSIMYDNIRGFKHDYFNFVHALEGYVKSNNINGIKNMIDEVYKECQEINDMGILDPKIINNPALYSLITNKFYLAQEKGIKMKIEVSTDLNKFNINDYNFCRIISILLDNAIEASAKSKEKIINVSFSDEKKYKRKIVKIENSFNNPKLDIDKIFEKGYSSKKDKKNEHGLGLWIVRNILVKNNNLNLYTNIDTLFCQQLEIYQDIKKK